MAITDEPQVSHTIRHILGIDRQRSSKSLFEQPSAAPASSVVERDVPLPITNGPSGAHITSVDPMIPPASLLFEIPLVARAAHTVVHGRSSLQRILRDGDKRLMVIVGPRSITDIAAATALARALAVYAQRVTDDMVIVFRAFFEADELDATAGWTTMSQAPPDRSRVNDGLRLARSFLATVTSQFGLPCATRLVDIASPLYIGDLVSWAESCSVELASGVPMPVGFETTVADLPATIRAIAAAAKPHKYVSPTRSAMLAVATSTGNAFAHPVIQVSATPVPFAAQIEQAVALLSSYGLPATMVLDISGPHTPLDLADDSLTRRARYVADALLHDAAASVAGVSLQVDEPRHLAALFDALDILRNGVVGRRNL
ncbi:hypothetical protein SeMB42_g04572 [Synchytrium endobioticum]|uniref:3-deoxy-7-phosphoheptulonate synthase n=1 Tax=Synchytrium endobioticum TaxID=286115 RepID=A0A507DDE9_9FUNG|nr:hypothetical protein SeMB42_g04572 [Synchytrium endobioticum]TPX49634.1 hypothetical protein SeLEV6574_g01365 [Synchytrium endobioticum]